MDLSVQESEAFWLVSDKLSSIESMEQAVQVSQRSADQGKPGVFWDPKTQRAQPGRLWVPLDRMPPLARAELIRPYTAAEVSECRRVTQIDRVEAVPAGKPPQLLVVIGPAGAGKSTGLPRAAKQMNLDLDTFVSVDGDDLRSVHGGWREHIEQRQMTGYIGALNEIKQASWAKYKDEIKIEAIQSRKNLMFSCAKGSKMDGFTQLRQFADYEVNIFGLMVDFRVSSLREKNRTQVNGRSSNYTRKEWLATMGDIQKLCQEGSCKQALVIDNSDFSQPRVVYSRTSRHADLALEIDILKSHL